MSKKFSPDQRAADRESAELELGGLTWHPRRKTNRLTAEIQALAQASADLVEDLEPGAEIPADVTAKFNYNLYEQIAVMVQIAPGTTEEAKEEATITVPDPDNPDAPLEIAAVDAAGRPVVDWLVEILDVEDATPTIAFLTGRDPEKVIAAMEKAVAAIDEATEAAAADPQPGTEASDQSTPTPSPTPSSPASPQTSDSADASLAPKPAQPSSDGTPVEAATPAG